MSISMPTMRLRCVHLCFINQIVMYSAIICYYAFTVYLCKISNNIKGCTNHFLHFIVRFCRYLLIPIREAMLLNVFEDGQYLRGQRKSLVGFLQPWESNFLLLTTGKKRSPATLHDCIINLHCLYKWIFDKYTINKVNLIFVLKS